MDSKKSPKVAKIFTCENCDYICSKSSDYTKHLFTLKHKKRINDSKMVVNDSEKSHKMYQCECGKIYKYDSGYYRHKKLCKQINNIKEFSEDIPIESNNDILNKDLIMMIIKENSELKTVILDQQNLMMKVLENGTHNNNNNTSNSHNKAFNLNFFLNETCKDAMNIMDFVESIKLQLSDFENVGDIGFVNGISNIIVKNLKALDITKRPVHCTDQKRETIYIKDENKWEKEDDNKQRFRKFIKKVVSKNHRLILKFQQVYPDYNKYSSPNSTRYDKIIIEAMGGKGDNDIEKEDKIISNISKVIGLDKDTV